MIRCKTTSISSCEDEVDDDVGTMQICTRLTLVGMDIAWVAAIKPKLFIIDWAQLSVAAVFVEA